MSSRVAHCALPAKAKQEVLSGWRAAPADVLVLQRGSGSQLLLSVVNFGAPPAALPEGRVLLCSGALDDEGRLPTDTAAWIRPT